MTKTQGQINQNRLIFYALLEAAMRYREGFWREDIEAYEQEQRNYADKYNEDKPLGVRNKVNSKVKGIVLNFQQDQEKLNKYLYGILESLNKSFSEAGKVAFDNYSTAYGLMANHLAETKNTTELLTVCELYNTGALDYLFTEARTQELNDKINKTYENKNPNPHDTNITDVTVQEKQSGASSAEQSTTDDNYPYK